MQPLLFDTEKDDNLWFRKEKCDYHIVDTERKLARLVEILEKAKLISLDIETNGFHPINNRIVGVSFCVEVGTAYYIPIDHMNSPLISKEMFKSYLYNVLTQTPILGHNIKFDYKFIKEQIGVPIKCAHDTYIITKLLEEFDGAGLKYLGEVIFGFEVAELDHIMKKYKIKADRMHMLMTTELYEYACQDVDLTLRLFKYFWLEMEWRPDFIYDVEIALIFSLAKMETRGVKIDIDLLRKLQIDYTKQVEDYGNKIKEILELPDNFNIDSGVQLGTAFLERYPGMKKQVIYTEKSGAVKLNEECVNKYVTRFGKYLEKKKLDPNKNIFVYHQKRKKVFSLLTKYINSWINTVETNKSTTIVTNFNALGASTGRMSSNDPNMQNVAPGIRYAIVPREGYYFISMDYDQVEYRILAAMAKLLHLVDEINKEGADVHAIAASILFKVNLDKIVAGVKSGDKYYKGLRKKAKTLNFGLLYGMGIKALAAALGTSEEEAEELKRLYNERFLKGTTWFKDVLRFARKFGYVLTAFGRKRRIDNINLVVDRFSSKAEQSETRRLLGRAKRKAINSPIQGTSADIIKIGLNKVTDYLITEKKDIHPIIVVHDDILFEVNKKYTPEEVIPELKSCLETNFKEMVTLTVDHNVSEKSWGELKE